MIPLSIIAIVGLAIIFDKLFFIKKFSKYPEKLAEIIETYDFDWKNLRVSKATYFNCYYNIDPFTFEYNINTEKEINGFMTAINSFAEYNCISSIVESEIIANHNNKCIIASSNA